MDVPSAPVKADPSASETAPPHQLSQQQQHHHYPLTASTTKQSDVETTQVRSSDQSDRRDDEVEKELVGAAHRGFRFWAIIISLSVVGILSALENTVVVTSLPFIVEELNMGENYIWVTNAFFLTAAAVQPLFGQLANIFGRRWLTLAIVALFVLGSGISGGATNGAMLIAGRAVQGMGGGGINMIVDVVISDMVPLRERGNFMAIVLTVYFVGTALGPYVGGAIVDNTTWRWVFYINLPIGGVAMIMILIFLQVRYNKQMTFLQKIKRIDYIGNIILVGSTVSILYALTYGGTRYSWSHWSMIFTLIVGLLGLVMLMVFENSKFVKEPVVPPRLFGNRTSATIFAITFLNSALMYWVLFFLPVYFQTVLLSSPSRSGVQLLPIIVIAVPMAIVAVLLLTKFGKYKILHLSGFAACTVGVGLMTLLDRNSSTAEWVIYQLIAGGGSGFVLNTLLPACQAGLLESDQAAATAAWSFVRSFGSIWGVAIPAAIFNNRFTELSYRISDASVRQTLANGRAYEYATAAFVKSFPLTTQNELIGLYSDALKLVWQISIVFSGISFLLVFLEKQIKLRTDLETEFGMAESKKDQAAKAGDVEKAGSHA